MPTPTPDDFLLDDDRRRDETRSYYLAAFRNAAATLAAGDNSVVFDTVSQKGVEISSGAGTSFTFNSLTGIYTVRKGGIYYANGKIASNGGVVGGRLLVYVAMGGINIRGEDRPGSVTGFDTWTAVGVRNLTSGQTIAVRYNFVAGGPQAMAVGSLDVSHFFVYRIGD